MLAMTPDAAEAVSAILAQDEVPEGSGLRIHPVPSPDSDSSEAMVGATIQEEPAQSDQVVEDGDARLFVAEELVEPLEDQVLDADVGGERIEFAFRPQGAE